MQLVELTDIQKVFDAFLKLNVEGMTVAKISEVINLPEEQIETIIKNHCGLFYQKKIKDFVFYYLRHSRFLKTAYFVYRLSNLTQFNFDWTPNETEFFLALTEPKWFGRLEQNVFFKTTLSRAALNEIIDKYTDQHIITRRGKRLVFTYFGLPLWATIHIARIFMGYNPKPKHSYLLD